jgi:hypothetical protein
VGRYVKAKAVREEEDRRMEAKRAKLAEAAKQQDRDRRALDLRARERTRLKAALSSQVCDCLTHLPLPPSSSVRENLTSSSVLSVHEKGQTIGHHVDTHGLPVFF